MTNTMAHRSTGMVRMPAATKRAKRDIQSANKWRVAQILTGNDARKPRSVPAKDISTVSQSATLAVDRIDKSGGTISAPRIRKLRIPRDSRSESKKPKWANTASRKRAVVIGSKSVDFT